MPQISFSRFVLLAGIVLAVFFVELGAARLWDRDEPRNSRASHEMLERGDWIVPTFNGELRDHKPILLYWGQMISYLAVGESEFAARLPSALCSILAVLAVAVLGSRLSGRLHGISLDGFWAAGVLATCLLFVMAGRAATPDACLIAFSTLGIASLVVAAIYPTPPYSSGRVGKARWIPAIFGYTMLGLAALAKGPVGIVLPLAVVHVWWLICWRQQTKSNSSENHSDRSLGQRGMTTASEFWLTFHPIACLRALWSLRLLPGVIVCLVAAAPWYVAVGIETDGAFLRGFFLEHNLGRAVSSMEGHRGSIFFYPIAFLVGTFPWSLWLIPILMWMRTAARECVVGRQMVVLAGTWVSVYVIAFSMASTKLPSYITPCYAGAALAIGGYLRQFESTWALPSINWRRAAYGLAITVGLGIAGGIFWLSSHESMPLLARASICGIVVAAMGALAFVWERQQRVGLVPVTWLVGAAAFHVILFGFGAKSVDAYRSDLRLLSHVNQGGTAKHWLAIGGLEPSWVHYLNREIFEVTASPNEEQGWNEVSDFLAKYPDGRIVVVGDEAISRLAEIGGSDGFGWTLEQVAASERFLRPGRMAIYKLPEGQVAFTVTSAVQTRARQTDEVNRELTIPAQTIGHVRELDSPQQNSADSSEVQNQMRVGKQKKAQSLTPAEFPNPLRPRR